MESGGHWEAYNVNETATTTDENVKSKKSNAFENGPTCQNTGSECKPSETLGKLENVRYIYRQDVVKSKTDGKIGIVTEVVGDSDSDSGTSDDEDEDEDDIGDNNDDEDIGYHEEGDLENNGSAEGSPERNADIGNHSSSPLPADQVRVLWMNETETTYSINDVAVIDRGFLQGDYVASASDETGQVGVVVDINILVDLLTQDGSVVKNISTRELKRVGDFTVGDYVVLGPWLGRIDDVLDNVTVMFDDGSVCNVIKADPLRLKPVGRNSLEGGNFPYYPGQHVKASSSSVFKNSRCLSGLWKANQLEGTVTKVTSGSVFIYWIASAGYGPDSSTPPANEQSPKNLKLLSCFAHTNWQLGDWCLLPSLPLSSSNPLDGGLSKLRLGDSIHENVSRSAQTGVGFDTVVSSEESNWNSESMENDAESLLDGYLENNNTVESSSCGSVMESFHESWMLSQKKIHKDVVKRDRKALKNVESFERALLIVNTKTNVDVAWQDGTVERGLESTCLIPIDSPGDHEFVAEQYVVEKDAYDACQTRRVGIIRSVDAKDRTACVQWLKPVTRDEDPREFDKEEVVSVYELEGHPDYDYCYGDVVVKLTPVLMPAQLDSLESTDEESKQLFAPNEVKEDKKEHLGCKKREITLNDEIHSQFSDFSWVGNITGLRNGDIEVTWADGMISMVVPQAIYVVGHDGDESIAVGSDISDDAPSWETVEDDQMQNLENVEEDLGTQDATNIGAEIEGGMMATKSSGINGALAIPRAAIGFVSRLASGFFSRGQKQADSPNSDSRSEDEIQNQGWDRRMSSSNDTCYQSSGSMDNSGALSTTGKGGDCVAEVTDLTEVAEALISLKGEPENVSLQREDGTYVFKCFDITEDPHDHYFLGTSAQNNARRKWLRKVQQDWHILQNNLPDGIYVRVYEDRMDLLRAGIVGPHGTPYQDGLFFFDFHLPLEYPDVPPSAHYHSGGWRINPNLYEEGKVCLSLLKTWTGKGNEVWDPSSSSILQVLVSLQGLVLNSKPYFNEAGYEKQIGTAEGEKNSLSYNENTFLLNCKTMMYLMRKPPKEFEELVEEHFRRRGYYILKACDAYMKGQLIGSLTKDGWVSSSSAHSNSVGFKLMLAKIVPKLYIALSEMRGESREFEHVQHI